MVARTCGLALPPLERALQCDQWETTVASAQVVVHTLLSLHERTLGPEHVPGCINSQRTKLHIELVTDLAVSASIAGSRWAQRGSSQNA